MLYLMRMLSVGLLVPFIFLGSGSLASAQVISPEHVHISIGQDATIRITLNNPVSVGSFDLLLSFDAGKLYYGYAQPIGDLKSWEFFTYRYSEVDTCGGACPLAFLRLIGVANMPDSLDPGAVYQLIGDIIEIRFHSPKSSAFSGLCRTVGFVWNDCRDNTFNSISGDTVYALTGLSDSCTASLAPKEVVRSLTFQDGYICCIDPNDNSPDVNLNGVNCEVGDAVLFANYFIYGPSTWDPVWFENQILATDINMDGYVLTLADLQCLIRIITGDTDLWDCRNHYDPMAAQQIAEVDTERISGEQLVISLSSEAAIGAALFVFRHSGAEIEPPLLADDTEHMTIGSSDRDGLLRILVYSPKGNSLTVGKHQLFTIPITGNGTIELVEAQASSADGHAMRINVVK